jgi:hypothetical protein
MYFLNSSLDPTDPVRRLLAEISPMNACDMLEGKITFNFLYLPFVR